MNREELNSRYDYLYERMKNSKNPHNMKVFGASATAIFRRMVDKHPEIAEQWVESFEAILWDNYLSQTQARNIASHIVNQDGKEGPKWSEDVFFHAVEKLGGRIEQEPYYNKHALWLVANAMYSDHAQSSAEDMGFSTISEVPPDKMALSMYKKAVESLTDIDRPNYVERYYWRELHENID